MTSILTEPFFQRALLAGDAQTGITIMQMDAGLDTGDILLQRETVIQPHETAPELMDRLSFIGADLVSETLSRLDTLSPLPQDHNDASLAPIMKREDGLIDWSLSAVEIANRVRGFQPFPGSFTSYKGQKLTIWKAESVLIEEPRTWPEGKILAAGGDNLIVSTGGNTALSITELQVEGKRRMATHDVLNGIKINTGDFFGE